MPGINGSKRFIARLVRTGLKVRHAARRNCKRKVARAVTTDHLHLHQHHHHVTTAATREAPMLCIRTNIVNLNTIKILFHKYPSKLVVPYDVAQSAPRPFANSGTDGFLAKARFSHVPFLPCCDMLPPIRGLTSRSRRIWMKMPMFGIALLGMLAFCSGNASRVMAAGGHPLLLQSDAPPGFGKLHTKVYTTWVKKMKVTTKTTGLGKGANSCDALKGSKKDGWVRGMIQAFDSPSILSDFELCESVFLTAAGAKTASSAATADLTKQAAKVKAMKPIPGLSIGDASRGVFAVQGNFVNAELVFRHGTAVVLLLYLGSGQFTGAAFVAAAQRANGRIKQTAA